MYVLLGRLTAAVYLYPRLGKRPTVPDDMPGSSSESAILQTGLYSKLLEELSAGASVPNDTFLFGGVRAPLRSPGWGL